MDVYPAPLSRRYSRSGSIARLSATSSRRPTPTDHASNAASANEPRRLEAFVADSAAPDRHARGERRRQHPAAEGVAALVDEADGIGVIPSAPEEMLHNVFDFARREAAGVMVPAPALDRLDTELLVPRPSTKIIEHRRSRHPVGSDCLDRLVGVVHVREVVAAERTDPRCGARALAADRGRPRDQETRRTAGGLRQARQQLAVV